MSKTTSIVITVLLILGIGFVVFAQSKKSDTDVNTVESGQNVEIIDGIQYVTINAKGGYFPRTSTAQAGTPTKLIVKTNGTFDCSLALVIRSINYQKILSQTGEEVIDLGTPEAGTIQGLCSMGMYNFSIKFI